MKHVATIKGVRVNDWNWQEWKEKNNGRTSGCCMRQKKKLPFSMWRKHWKKHALRREGVHRVKFGTLIPIRLGRNAFSLDEAHNFVDPHSFMQCLNQRCQPPDIVSEGKAMILLYISRSSALIEVNRREVESCHHPAIHAQSHCWSETSTSVRPTTH